MADFDMYEDDVFEKDESPLKGDDKKVVDALLGEEQKIDDLKLTQSQQMNKLQDVDYLKKDIKAEEPVTTNTSRIGRAFAKPNFSQKPNQIIQKIASKPEFSKQDEALANNQQRQDQLQKTFNEFKHFLRNKKNNIELQKILLKSEKNVIHIILKTGLTHEMKEKIMEKRRNAWRGYIRLVDFQEFLIEVDFPKIKQEQILDFLKYLDLYNDKNKLVNYIKLFRDIIFRRPVIDQRIGKFEYVNYKPNKPRVREFNDKNDRTVFIQQQVRAYKQRKINKELKRHDLDRERTKKRLYQKTKEELDKEKELKLMQESAVNFFNIFKQKIENSDKNLQEIFNSIDEDADGYLNQKEFFKAFKQFDIPETILKQAYGQLDSNKDGKVSYYEFLGTLYGVEQKVFCYLTAVNDILQDMRVQFKSQFPTENEFLQEIKPFNNKISLNNFSQFIKKYTEQKQQQIQRYSQIQITDVFNFLDKGDKKYLEEQEALQIYEYQIEKKEINIDVLRKQKLKESQVNLEPEQLPKKEKEVKYDFEEAKKLWEDRRYQSTNLKSLDAQRNTKKLLGDKKQNQVENQVESKKRLFFFKENTHEMEDILKNISDKTQQKLKQQGKSLEDLFFLYCVQTFGYMNDEEFLNMMDYIFGKEFNLDLMKSVFYIFSNDYTKRMSLSLFRKLIEQGQNVNSLYLKLKFRFRGKLDAIKKKFIQEFQRLDTERGDGYILMNDFKELLEFNQIPFEDKEDGQMLFNEGYTKVIDNKLHVNYKTLLNVLFPQNVYFNTFILSKYANKIRRIVRTKRAIKEREKQLKLKKKQPKDKKVQFSKDEKKKTKTEEKSDLQIMGGLMRTKELTEIEEVEEMESSQLKKSTKSSKKAPPVKSTMQNQLSTLLPQKSLKDDPFELEKKKQNLEFSQQIFDEILEKAVNLGESIQLSKQIQQKFQNRPVTKNVFITLQDFELDVIDPLPNSISHSNSTARLLYIDKQCQLIQYDMANQRQLKPISIQTQVPLKKNKVIDCVFDNNSNRFYLLNSKWIIEVWDLGQNQTIPIARIRLFSENIDTDVVIDNSYKKRYQDTFPKFLILSQASHQNIIVNATCYNNSIIFIDPLSLSQYNVMYFNPGDYKMSSNLASIITLIMPKLQELQQQKLFFEEIFSGIFKVEEGIKCVTTQQFIDKFSSLFSQGTEDMWKELSNFLDQDNSGKISQSEYLFLYEMFNLVPIQRQQNIAVSHIIADISHGALKVLNMLGEYIFNEMKLNIESAFGIFDTDGSGEISINEFLHILHRACGPDMEKEKREVIAVMDKDGSRTIDINEFAKTFGMVIDPNTKNHVNNTRSNIMLCFSKSYAGGIDVEQLFLEQDIQKEGSIKSAVFRQLLEWLPLGLLDHEINSIMQNQLSYTDNGDVNYMKFMNTIEFKEMKFAFKLRKSLVQDNEIKRHKEKNESSKRQSILQNQKVIIETLIFLDEFELIIYTTNCPKTSQIFINEAKQKEVDKNEEESELFYGKLLARLSGHKSSNPPTIYYVKETGCLISGEKIDKQRGYQQSNQEFNVLSAKKLESYASSYANSDLNKDQIAEIFIWNLQKDLQLLYDSNPPWEIQPAKVITRSHNDSILSFAYLSYAQVIASSSMDKTIKLWDPISRPFPLQAPQNQGTIKLKPGYYKKQEHEETLTNQPFQLIRTIYTGESVCYNLGSFSKRIPIISDIQQAQDIGNKKNRIIEFFLATILDKPQLISNQSKCPGFIRAYSVNRMFLEVQGMQHDDIMPKKYQEELEKMCIDLKKKAIISYQMTLPQQLEKMQAENRVQDSYQNQMLSIIRSINLQKYDDSSFNITKSISQLFELMMKLPSRKACSSFLTGKQLLTANEIFFYFKKFHNLHPLTLSREKFFQKVKEFKIKQQKGLIAKINQVDNNLEKKIAEVYKEKEFDTIKEFSECQSAVYEKAQSLTPKNVKIIKEDFKKLLQSHGMYTTDEDFVELVLKLDPLFSGEISSNLLEHIFSNEIIENRLNKLSKPQELVKTIMNNLNPRQRAQLISFLYGEDLACDGYLRLENFLRAFQQVDGLVLDNKLLQEVFQYYSENFSSDEPYKVINLQLVQEKFFSPNENLGLEKFMYVMGKIKGVLLEQGKKLDYPFQEKSYQNSTPLMEISESEFIQKISNLKSQKLALKEIEFASRFMSIASEKNDFKPVISLNTFLHFCRKMQTRNQYLVLIDYKILYNEIKTNIIEKKEPYKEVVKIFRKKEYLEQSDIRYILNKLEVNSDLINEILVKLVNDSKFDSQSLLTRFQNFIDDFEGLNSQLPSVSKEIKNEVQQTIKNDSKFSMGDLFKNTEDKHTKQLMIKDYQYTEQLVNFLRTKHPYAIPILRTQSKFMDYNSKGVIDVGTWGNLIRNSINTPIVKDESEERESQIIDSLIINYLQEYDQYYGNANFNYIDFFEKYLDDQKLEIGPIEIQEEESDLNVDLILIKIATNVYSNIDYVLKFYKDKNNKLFLNDIIEYCQRLKCQLDKEEIKVLHNFFNSKDGKIDASEFNTAIYVAQQGTASSINKETWMICNNELGENVLEKLETHISFIQFLIKQKQEQFNQKLRDPLYDAQALYMALTEIKDFTVKQYLQIVMFAVVGCCKTQQEGYAKYSKLSKGGSLDKEVVNMTLFVKALPIVIKEIKKQREEELKKMIKVADKKEKKQEIYIGITDQKEIEKYNMLIAKVNQILDKRGVTLWDAILGANFTVSDQTKIPLIEFKYILNSLNLGLKLKEKLMLVRLSDPNNTGRCDIDTFIKSIQKDNKLTTRAINTILEKFSSALYINDLSIDKAFDSFDIDKDGYISKNEFLYGMNQLNLGLSLYEILQILEMIDLDKNSRIDKEEFVKAFQRFNKENKVDSLKDFSISLLTKIYNLISIKGADLLQALTEQDLQNSNFLTFDNLKEGLIQFGLKNLKNYQIQILYNIYKSGDQGKSKEQQVAKSGSYNMNKKQRDFGQKSNPSESQLVELSQSEEQMINAKINYKEFSQKILNAANLHNKEIIEQNNNLLKKVMYIIGKKDVSIFEAFVYMDVNQSGQLSRLELQVGFQNLGIEFEELEFQTIWKSFAKTKNNRVDYVNFSQKFIQAGCISILNLDDSVEVLLKKFANLFHKFGNYLQGFEKLDTKQNGQISIYEFKNFIQKQQFDFKQTEVELLFKAFLNSDYFIANKRFQLSESKETKTFSYRQFVQIMSHFSTKGQELSALFKLFSISQEKKIVWKKMFKDFNLKKDKNCKLPEELSQKHFKDLLYDLKIGLNNDEIESILNSFETEKISSTQIEQKAQEACDKLNEEQNKKSQLIQNLIIRMVEKMNKDQMPLERLFFEHDSDGSKTLNLREFNELITTLEINSNKQQNKILFQAIAIEDKEAFSLTQLKNFLSNTVFIGSKKEELESSTKQQRQEQAQLDEICRRLKSALQERQKSMQQILYECDLQEDQAIVPKNFQKFLNKMGVIPKESEIHFLIQKIDEQHQQGGVHLTPTFRNFLDFAIRQHVETIEMESAINYVHPSVVMCIDKMNMLFRKLEVDSKLAFALMSKSGRNMITQKQFIKMIQTLNLKFSQDDIVLLYQYFDDKSVGEITRDNFLEKFDYLANNSLKKPNETQEDDKLKIIKNSSKAQVIAVLQKIFFFMQDKKYNKKQIKALFDINGNNQVSRSELMETFKHMEIGISLTKARLIMEYLDKDDSGQIEIEELLKAMFDSVPRIQQKTSNQVGATRIFSDLVHKVLKKETPKFLQEFVELEEIVKFEDGTSLIKPKCGVESFKFLQLLRKFNIKLSEEDLDQIKDHFFLKMNPKYYDLESIYSIIESIYYQANEKNKNPLEFMEQDSASNIWEQKIYRKIGDYLRKNNLTIEKTFKHIDQDGSGLINLSEFKIFLQSIKIKDYELSDKEINQLVNSVSEIQVEAGLIPLTTFKQKFWEAYTIYGREQLKTDKIIKGSIDQLLGQKKQILVYIFMTLRDVSSNSVEKAWAILDVKKVGVADITDFRQALIKLGIYLSQNELSFAFNFLDMDRTGMINFFCFQEFWESGQNNLITQDSRFMKGIIINEMQAYESQVLEHLSHLVNQREINLWDSFSLVDKDELGLLNPMQFNNFLKSIGIKLESESKLLQLMRIIDPKSNGDCVHYSALEFRLSVYGLLIQKPSNIQKVYWKDKPLMKFIVALTQHIADKSLTIQQYFSDFDSDFDGFLSQKEFYNSIKYIGSDIKLQQYQIQRLAHKFVSKQEPKIEIKVLISFIQDMQIEVENQIKQNSEDLYSNYIQVDQLVFRNIIEYFDGLQSMFKATGELRTNFIQLKKKFEQKNLRGFNLASKQINYNKIDGRLKYLLITLENAIFSVKKTSTQMINSWVVVQNIDQRFNQFRMDQETLRIAQVELSQNKINIIDGSLYHIESDTLEYVTPYTKRYQGEVLKTSLKIEVISYPKDTLQRISMDGNSFEKHLDAEILLHQALMRKSNEFGQNFMLKNLGKNEKRIGIEASDKEIYVINEHVPDDFVNLYDLIRDNGGLLRIPFLVKTNAVTYLIKFWGRQILHIINQVHCLGHTLTILRPHNFYISNDGSMIKLSNVRGTSKINHLSRISMGPDMEINLVPDHGPLQAQLNQSFEGYDQANYNKYLQTQAYLAPEMIMQGTLQLTPYIDIWAFGCLLYEILFGHPPLSYILCLKQFQQGKNLDKDTSPSDYFYYELFPDELINDILKSDYNDLGQSDEGGNMIKAINKKSFGAIFDKLFDEFQSEHPLGFEQLGEILDMISVCLEYEPYKRPTVEAMLNSKLFKQDNYEKISSKQFAESMMFYKSPSTSLRDKVFIPLRKLCAITISENNKILDYTSDLLNLLDIVQEISIPKSTKQLEDLQNNIQIDNNKSHMLKKGMPIAMIKKLQLYEKSRRKLSNFVLVKYLFDNDIIDMLVFLTLIHHRQSIVSELKLVKNTSTEKATTNTNFFNQKREITIRVLKSLKKVFQALVLQLQEYNTSVAPYVSKVVENLVKFFLGEEYKLSSDTVDYFSDRLGYTPTRNIYEEYQKNKTNETRFFQKSSEELDEADKAYIKQSKVRPYIYQSKNWTPILYNVVGSLFKETISDAGVGQAAYPVIQDYIRYCTERAEINEMDITSKMKKINETMNRQIPRTADYYNDMIMVAENLQIIFNAQEKGGNVSHSALRIVLSYFKSMLLTQNMDKIKLLLDSRAPIYLIPLLSTDNAHIRGELIDIFYEISKGFAQQEFSYLKSEKKTDEINRNMGIVAHINLYSEDKIDRQRFLDSANDYYFLRKQVNQAYIYSLAFVFENPVLIQNIFYTLKTKAELIQTKLVLFRTFENLLNSSNSIIKLLFTGTMDVFTNVFKALIKAKPGMPSNELKVNKILGPVVEQIYAQIERNSRSEVIDLMNKIPKLKVYLKEINKPIPTKLNVSILQSEINNLTSFYNQYRRDIILEIKGKILSKQTRSSSESLVNKLQFTLKSTLQKIISWFQNQMQSQNNLMEAKTLIEDIVDISKTIFDDMIPYGQVNESSEQVIIEISDFIEVVINQGYYYIIFNKGDPQRSSKCLQWIMDAVIRINQYHDNIEENQNEIIQREKSQMSELQKLKKEDSEEYDKQNLTKIIDHDSLRKFSTNKLNKISHSFLRILLKLTEIQEQYIFELLGKVKFGQFFMRLVKNQFRLLQGYIDTKTEKLHVLSNYVEETNFRVMTFESIFQGQNEELKNYLVSQGFINQVCGIYFTNESEFDLSQTKTTMKFLPFKDFLPFRNEALSMITAIVWHRAQSQTAYKELLLQFTHYNLVKREFENLNKHNVKSKMFLSSMYFFSILVDSNDSQLLFLMVLFKLFKFKKHERVNQFLITLFEKQEDYRKYFPKLYKAVNPTNIYELQ